MTSHEFIVLDVGHGNCTIYAHPDGAVVVDVANGALLSSLLHEHNITLVRGVLISHSDADHVAGLIDLLVDEGLDVERVYLNADALRDGPMWEAVRVALADARKRRRTSVRVGLTSGWLTELENSGFEVEVLAPTPELAVIGAGGKDANGRVLTANTMSAVVRLSFNRQHSVLLTGDLDSVGLDHLLAEHPSPKADVLVFPHHGGRPGSGDPQAFAARLVSSVSPSWIVFSLGRGKYGNPLPEIMIGARRAAPGARVLCTQLSERCAPEVPPQAPTHLVSHVAKGRAGRRSCGGTATFVSEDVGLLGLPGREAHLAFVRQHAPTALCIRALPV